MADTDNNTELVFDDTMKKKKKKVSSKGDATEEVEDKKKKSSKVKSEDAGEGEKKKKSSSSKSETGEKKKKSSKSEEGDAEKPKKKKSSKTEEEGDVEKPKKKKSSKTEEEGTATQEGDDEEFTNIDLSKMKKKSSKKSSSSKGEDKEETTTTTSTGRKASPYHYDLESTQADTKEIEADDAEEDEIDPSSAPDGVTWKGTDRDYKYSELTYRIYHLIGNFELASDQKHKMKPPEVFRETTKKTVWANFAEICQTLNRKRDHVLSYVFAELGTNGSIDGNDRLIIRGRFNPSQIEIVIRHYIAEYVACRNCKSPNTILERNNRLYFLCCNACNSKRSVVAIKKGLELGRKPVKEN